MIQILQTTIFKKQVKKLHKNQKKDLDQVINVIVKDPFIGQQKKGDLSNVRVYKFKMVGKLTLLAYEYFDNKLQLVLLTFGGHENFYRDLKS